MGNDNSSERRRFKRVNAPVFCRPLGRSLTKSGNDKQLVEDISMGGVRVFTDDKHTIGDRLELDLFLPDGAAVCIESQVVWIESLPGKDAPAKFELGLKYVDVAEKDRKLLEAVLKEA